MEVYIVTQSWGIYSDYTEVVLGVVSSMEKAKELSLNAEPVSWEDSTVEVECFELDGERYKSNDDFSSKDRIILNELDEAGI